MPLKLIILLHFVGFQVSGQEFHNSFRRFNTQDGLSQNDIRSIFQDSDGFIWIGTHDGLNRFDGYSFKIYQKEIDNKNSLSSNLINNIAEDSKGNLWIGTDDEGIILFEKETQRFTAIRNTASQPNIITDNHINSMLIDSDDLIWVGSTEGLNIISYDYNTRDFVVEKVQSSKKQIGALRENRISTLYQDKIGNIWVGTFNGLYRHVPSKTTGHQFIFYDNGPQSIIRSITSNDSSLLISSNNVFALSYREINKHNPKFKLFINTYYSRLLSDSRGILWGSGLNGLHAYYKEHEKMNSYHFSNSWSDHKSLSKNITTRIMEDRSGIIWIGTNGGGINLYNPNKKNFRLYQKNQNAASLSYNKIRAVFEDDYDNLWIGTEGGGANFLASSKYPNYNSGFKQFSVNQGDTGENYVYALAALPFQRNKLLMGTGYNSNLELIALTSNGRPKTQPQPFDISHTASVFSLLNDENGCLWTGTYGKGLKRIMYHSDGSIKDIKVFRNDVSIGSSLSSNIIRSINEDQDGNIWIGTDKGLNRLTKKEKYEEEPHFIQYFNIADVETSLSNDYVLLTFVDSDNDIWIGTLGGGLNKLLKSDIPGEESFERITTKSGLPNNVIKAIEEDKEDNLWIASNRGLSRFNKHTRTITNFDINDGLQDFEFSELASTTRRSGEMIFGGVNGFNAFFPHEITLDSSEVEVVFTSLNILNQTIKIGQKLNNRVILKKDLNQIEKLDFNHLESSFSIGFSALHYASPESNQYSYMLEGFDENWVFTDAQNRIAKYTNLSPGEYILKVKASNGDGLWTKKSKDLMISVAPPFWKTHWAIAFYWILLMTCLWFFRKYTLITNSRKNEFLLEHLEKEKIEEVNQLKLKFFTNVSHEFRTPLTLILGLIERLQNNALVISKEDRRTYYQKIYKNSQVLLNLINQLLDFRKIEHGKMNLSLQSGNITQYLKDLAESFNELAKRKSIDYEIICHDEIIGWYDKHILERIIFNLLSNAFKFTESKGEISFLVASEGDMVKIQVIDNGVGMPKNVQTHLFERFSQSHLKKGTGSGIGLAFTKSLIELYDGEIGFTSKVGSGTNFTVHIPYKKEFFKEEDIEKTLAEDGVATKDLSWLIDQTDLPKQASEKKDYTLLLVEDNEDILFYLQEHFKIKYNVEVAHDGNEALNICLGGNIDLVLSDITMPGMDGLEFCNALKQDDRINHIPIILLTAKTSSADKVKGYEKGADAYVPKPFNIEELDSRTEALLANRQILLGKLKKNMDLTPSEVQVTSLDEKFLKRVMSIIEENIGNSEFTVDVLSRECGMSTLHLNKKLKVLVGITANSFTRSIRLKRASQLLQKGQYSVNEVMYEVGFIDAKYFRSCFKKEFGTTPSEHQKLGEQK